MTATGIEATSQQAEDLVAQFLEFTGAGGETGNVMQARSLLMKHNGNMERAIDDWFNDGAFNSTASTSKAPMPYIQSNARPVPPPPSGASHTHAPSVLQPSASGGPASAASGVAAGSPNELPPYSSWDSNWTSQPNAHGPQGNGPQVHRPETPEVTLIPPSGGSAWDRRVLTKMGGSDWLNSDAAITQRDSPPQRTQRGASNSAYQQTPDTVDLTRDGEDDMDDDLRRALAASLEEGNLPSLTSHQTDVSLRARGQQAPLAGLGSGDDASGTQKPQQQRNFAASREQEDLQRAIQMSMAGVSQDPCINSSDDQDDTMRNSAHSHTHAAHGPLMPAQIHVPPLSLNSGGSGTPSSQQVNPNVSWVHFDSSTTAGRQADAQSGWVPPVSPKGGGIGGLGAVESTIAGAPVTSWALRPEVLVTRARASSAGTDANAGKPPVGLVAPTPILQGFASLLQGLYATPAAREAILSVCPPDARAEDVDNFWRGEAPSAKTSAQAREQVGEQQQPETMDEATNVSAGSQQQDPVAPKISVNAEEGDAFAAETSDVVMECVASDSPTAQARVAIDGEAEKQPGPGAQTTITTADAEADAGMDTGGEHQEQREVGSLITRAADSIIVLQRIQTLFAYMQTSNRAWVQISDVAAVLQFHAQEALSRSEGPADVVRYLFAVVAQAFRDTSLLNARLQLKNDDQISEEMESQRQAAEKIDSFKNELDFVFTSTGGRTLCYEAHTDLPDRIESTPTLYLHPDKLHSSISLAFRQTLSQGNFLIHRPARVMLFLLDHTSRGDKFEYDDPLFIDQLLWEKRKGAALPVVHPQEMQKLHQEEQVARAESLKLAQFKGQDPLQLLESSIEYFDTLSQGKGDPETSATGMNVLESLRKMLDGLKSARRELESKMDTAKQKQEALERKLVEDFSETAKQPQWQQVRYDLRALICPAGEGLFPLGTLALVKGDDDEWWRVAPNPSLDGAEAGTVQKLTPEEVVAIDQLRASMAIYGLAANLGAKSTRASCIWPTESIQAATVEDNLRISAEFNATTPHLYGLEC